MINEPSSENIGDFQYSAKLGTETLKI